MNRRHFLTTASAALSLAFLAPLEGCDTTTIADFVSLIGTDAAALANYFNQTALAAQIKSLSSQIAVDITNWQSGSPASSAIAAINDLIGLIDTIPVVQNSPYSALIVLLLSALTGLLALIPQSGMSTSRAVATKHYSVTPMPIKGTDKKSISAAKRQFDAQWTTLTANTPGVK